MKRGLMNDGPNSRTNQHGENVWLTGAKTAAKLDASIRCDLLFTANKLSMSNI
jgi:hypothetical protein